MFFCFWMKKRPFWSTLKKKMGIIIQWGEWGEFIHHCAKQVYSFGKLRTLLVLERMYVHIYFHIHLCVYLYLECITFLLLWLIYLLVIDIFLAITMVHHRIKEKLGKYTWINLLKIFWGSFQEKYKAHLRLYNACHVE